MNTRIKHFVEHYKAVLALKRKHTKRINIRDFVVEAALIFLISFGIVPIVGLLGNLNESFAYLYIASIAMIVFNYIILMWLFETRYQLQNKLEYNIWHYIIPKTFNMILVLLSGILVYGATVGLLLLTNYYEVEGLFWVFGFILVVIVMAIQTILPEQRSLMPYLYQGIMIAILYWMLSLVLNYNLYMLWMYIAHILIILILIGRDLLVISHTSSFTGPFGIVYSLLFLGIAGMVFSQVFYWADFDDITQTVNTKVHGTSIEDGRVVGTYIHQENLYIKYLDTHGMYADVYNDQLEYQYSTEPLDLYFDFITIDQGVYAVAEDPVAGEIVLYQLSGDTFVEQLRVSIEYSFYNPVKIGDSYWFIMEYASRNEQDELIRETRLYRALNGVVTEENLSEADINITDDTTTFIIEDGTVYIDSLNNVVPGTMRTYLNLIDNQPVLITGTKNVYYTFNYDEQTMTLYDETDTAIATDIPRLPLSDQNYFTSIEQPFVMKDTIYVPYTSRFPYQDQNIIVYTLFDMDGELLDIYKTTGTVFVWNDTVYEIKDSMIREYGSETITVYGNTVTIMASIVMIGTALMIPLKTKGVLIGGEDRV